MLLPLFFLLGRAVADVALILVALAFLWRSACLHDWRWLREPWVQIGIAWVAWLVFAGLFAAHIWLAVSKAAVEIRFVVFAAALATLHLRDKSLRGNFLTALAAAVLLVAIDCLIQVTTGTSLTGQPLPEAYRLSGPFTEQKAGTYLAKVVFILLLPVLVLVERRVLSAWLPLACLGGIGLVIMLTGERSAWLTFGLGSLLCLFALPRLRRLALPALLLGVLGVGSLALVHPILIERFVGQTEGDLNDFADKRYGLIFRTGVALFEEQPLTGIGVGEYPLRCLEPALDRIGPREIRCVSHPHNPWMEMLVEGGVVTLGLWLALLCAWLIRFKAGGRTLFVVGSASLLPFAWPLMSSMSLFVTWNAVLWWQAVGLMLAVSADPATRPRSTAPLP